ncbi:MAG: hypothetical protein WAN65_10110 [Candidatus Sulfotelmatobacter sp.]
MSAKRQLMAEQWDQFARLTLPKDCSATQRQEVRRAFYAGAQGILHGVIAAFAPESEPTTADLQIMADLERELSDFADAVKAGRA